MFVFFFISFFYQHTKWTVLLGFADYFKTLCKIHLKITYVALNVSLKVHLAQFRPSSGHKHMPRKDYKQLEHIKYFS